MSAMLTLALMVESAKTRIMITRAIAFQAQAGEEKTVMRVCFVVSKNIRIQFLTQIIDSTANSKDM